MSRLLTSLVRSAAVFAVIVLFCSVAVAAEQSSDTRIAQTSVGSTGLSWQPAVSYHSAVLTVSGPGEFNLRREFAAGEALAFHVHDTKEAALEDGQYAWELRFSPVTDRGVKEALRAARESGDVSQIEALKKQGKLPAEPLVVSGYFRVVGGSIVVDKAEASMPRGGGRVEPSGSTGAVDTDSGVTTKDQVILDDLIVDGSICVGGDCVNGESFGFDTIRLKENNLRIKAQDTSNTSSFPSRDWQITFNDSANGGLNKFSIDDIDGGRTPFTIEGNAPSHSLYVDDGGRVGFGTSTPVVDLHVKSGNTPTLRLEQDGSSGFTPQTWDVAGNEAGFFIRDATNGSTLPFRIIPGASSQSLVIDSDDDVGIGAGTSPSASLHVKRSDGTAQLFVEEVSGTEAARTLFNLENNGVAYFRVADTSPDGSGWTFQAEGPSFRFNKAGSGGAEVVVRGRNDAGGQATFSVVGSVSATNVTFTSSRLAKTEFAAVDSVGVLQKVVALPISEWIFKDELNGRRHIGPMAEEFAESFGLGGSVKNISLIDASGVTLAAIQGLHALLEEKNARIEELTDRVAELAVFEEKSATIEELMKRVTALEAQLSHH